MARIRTIKPDFWEDEKIGELTHGARLLFIGCLNLADDEGLLRWNEMYLGSTIFPYDDIKIETIKKWMSELELKDLVFAYQSGTTRQKLGWIIKFLKHQRIDKPQPSKFTPPSIQDRKVKEHYFNRDNGICQICGGEIDLYGRTDICGSKALSLDHIKHKTKGGNDHPSNIRASHLGCNKSRSGRDDSQINGDYAERFNMNQVNSDNHSANISDNNSTPEWKGMEKESKVEGGESNSHTRPQENSDLPNNQANPPPVAPPPSHSVGPPIEDVIRYFSGAGGTEEMAKAFWNKWDATEWMDGYSRIKNWASKANNFIANWHKNEKGNGQHNGRQSNQNQQNQQPRGTIISGEKSWGEL